MIKFYFKWIPKESSFFSFFSYECVKLTMVEKKKTIVADSDSFNEKIKYNCIYSTMQTDIVLRAKNKHGRFEIE